PLEPNIVVQSSPGKYHYYWLTDTDNGKEYEAVLRGMVKKYHADPACTDMTRIMRLPGFRHNKSGKIVTAIINKSTPYSWEKIKRMFPPEEIEISMTESAEYKESDFDFATAKRDIIAGEEIHVNRRGLGMHYANMGINEQHAVDELIDLVKISMELGNCDKKRGMERINNMAADVKSAYSKVNKEYNVVAIRSAVKQADKFTRLPMPKGGLKVIVDDVLKYMHHPNKGMAILVAQHVTGVYCGGMYKLRGCIGNRKRTILAPSSMGKSIASNYFKELTRRMAMQEKTNIVDVYLYSTGGSHNTANLHKEFFDHRVRSSIVNEAGLDGQTKSGMPIDQRRQWMDILTMGAKSVLSSKQYSNNNQLGRAINADLGDLYGVVGIQLAESVPENFVEVLHKNNAFLSGDVGRQELVFVDPEKSNKNYEAAGDIDSRIVKALYSQIRQFHNGEVHGGIPNNSDKFISIDTSAIMKAYIELDEAKIKEYNSCREDPVRQALCGRYMERVETTMLTQIQADLAFDFISKPVASMDHFSYAVDYQDELSRSLLAQMEGGSLADPLTRCTERIANRMDDFGTQATDRVHAVNLKSRTVSRAWITKVLGNYGAWKELIVITYNSTNRAKEELIRACEDRAILIPLPAEGKIPKWRLNK
ncbi:MAG: hypothetical protein DRI98_12125, partial [Bacteroidetes bacterium]